MRAAGLVDAGSGSACLGRLALKECIGAAGDPVDGKSLFAKRHFALDRRQVLY